MFSPQAQAILTRLEQAGYQAFAVGGCVRDTLLGRTPGDWDITTSALPEQVMALFDAVPTGIAHGTVTVRLEGRGFEVTTFRGDGPYLDGRHPSGVVFTRHLEEDLARRDFTVNAMAMDLRGRITDPFGGREDLQRRLLRCVGDPERRLQEDALRILRALRFAAVLGFSVEPETAAALVHQAHRLDLIAPERVSHELQRLLTGAYVGPVLRQFAPVLAAVLPEIRPLMGFEQHSPHHRYDVWEHTVRSVETIAPQPVLRWTMLLHDVAKPQCFTLDEQGKGHFYGHDAQGAAMAEEILRRLRLPRRDTERIVLLIREHMRQIAPTEKSVGRALHRLGPEALGQLLAVQRADRLATGTGDTELLDQLQTLLEKLLAEERCFTLRQLAVNGRELMALGLAGPAVGRMLQQLLAQVLDGTLPNDHAALLDAAQRSLEEQENP